MLLALLLAASQPHAASPHLVAISEQAPIRSVVELAVEALPARAFDALDVVPRPAGFGHTSAVYGIRAGIRTRYPVAVVRHTPTGRPVRLATWSPHIAPLTGPPLSADDTLARAVLDAQFTVAGVGPVRWWPLHDQLVAARVVWSDQPAYGLAHPVLLVDATTGRVLDITDDTTHGLGHSPHGELPPAAHIYPIDPVLTPDIETVELPESTRYGLVSQHFSVHRCTDLGRTYTTNSHLGEVDLRHCEWVAPVPPDGGQWLFPPEPYPPDPALDQDDFAGPHLLWHGEDTLDDFIALGLPLDARPAVWQRLMAQTNRRTTDLRDEVTMTDPTAPLETYDNAFFRRGRETSDGGHTHPEVVFGQGSVGDFAYDVDVVIHELGHFAVWSQDGPSSVRSTDHGTSVEPGALNEGLADYFAAIRTLDPTIGTYSGESLGRPYIRTLDGTARCPDALYGQVHADSQPFSQALWSTREALAEADRVLLDRSVVDALPLIGTTGGFDAAVQAIVSEAELQLGTEAADRLATEFASRSVDACEPFFPVENGVEVRSFSQVPAFYADLYDQPIPGPVQFIIDADGPIELTLTFEQRESLDVDLWGTNVPQDVVLLARSGGPLTHTPEKDPDTDLFVWLHDGEQVGEATHLESLGPTLDGRDIDHRYSGTVTLRGAGPHYIQLANLAERTVTARALVFSWEPTDPLPDTGSPAHTDPHTPSPEKPGCGCHTSSLQRAAWLGWLPFIALVARRRSSSPHP